MSAYVGVYMYIYIDLRICIYIYIYRERDGEGERERQPRPMDLDFAVCSSNPTQKITKYPPTQGINPGDLAPVVLLACLGAVIAVTSWSTSAVDRNRYNGHVVRGDTRLRSPPRGDSRGGYYIGRRATVQYTLI